MRLSCWMLLSVVLTYGCKDDGDVGDENNNVPTTSDICDKLIECARATGQAGVTALIAAYGSGGTCWSMPGVKESDCWTECRATMEPLRLANPTVGECRECTDASECAVFNKPYCDMEGACSDSICGNQQLEGDEVCDDSTNPDCNEDCTHDYFECNPLNDPRPCPAGMKCDLVADDYYAYDVFGECVTAGPGGLYAECDGSQCQAGYVCIIGSRVSKCPNGGPHCCTPWCDLSSAASTCPDGLSCYTMGNVFSLGSDVNIMNIGYCGSSQ